MQQAQSMSVHSPTSFADVGMRLLEGVVGSSAPVAPALRRPCSSSSAVRDNRRPRIGFGRYKNDCVTMVTSNINVPPLPSKYLCIG